MLHLARTWVLPFGLGLIALLWGGASDSTPIRDYCIMCMCTYSTRTFKYATSHLWIQSRVSRQAKDVERGKVGVSCGERVLCVCVRVLVTLRERDSRLAL